MGKDFEIRLRVYDLREQPIEVKLIQFTSIGKRFLAKFSANKKDEANFEV